MRASLLAITVDVHATSAAMRKTTWRATLQHAKPVTPKCVATTVPVVLPAAKSYAISTYPSAQTGINFAQRMQRSLHAANRYLYVHAWYLALTTQMSCFAQNIGLPA